MLNAFCFNGSITKLLVIFKCVQDVPFRALLECIEVIIKYSELWFLHSCSTFLLLCAIIIFLSSFAFFIVVDTKKSVKVV